MITFISSENPKRLSYDNHIGQETFMEAEKIKNDKCREIDLVFKALYKLYC